MTRRALFAALAGAALDPERLVWTPHWKVISIPATVAAIRPCPFHALSIHQPDPQSTRMAQAFIDRRWRTDARFRKMGLTAIDLGTTISLAGGRCIHISVEPWFHNLLTLGLDP